ncbi:MAG: hypothetical protein OXI61_17980 [Candidatus Poribacteria bacterium]|nr:hypothetical protein [Candidatus Poribacteria bacterium]
MSLPKIVCLTFFLFGIVTLAANDVAFWNEAISVEDSMEPLPVKPGRKLTTTWGSIKTLR